MEIVIFLQTIDEPFLIELIADLRSDIDGLQEIAEIEAPELETGFFVMLSIYMKERFQYPAYSRQLRYFSKKKREVRVSVDVAIEEIAGKQRDDIYNLVLDRIIETLPVFRIKKIESVPVEVVENALLSLRYPDA